MAGISTQRVGHAFRETGTRFVTGSGFEWVLTPEKAFGELAVAYSAAIHRAVFLLMKRYEPQVTNWMRDNASWTDRTGNARQGLHTEVQDLIGTAIVMWLKHGVDYGLFLEVSNAGKYAIITPAIDYFAPRIWADVVRMLRP